MGLPERCDCGHPFISNRVIKGQKANGFITRTAWGTHFIATTANQRSVRDICFASSTIRYNKHFIVNEDKIDKRNPAAAIWEHPEQDLAANRAADNWPLRSGQDSWQPAGYKKKDTLRYATYLPALPAIEEPEDCWQPPPFRRMLGSDDETDTSISSSPPTSPRAASSSRAPATPNEEETLQNPPDTSQISKAIYCHICEIWLNGPEQWTTHQGGQKHRRKITADQRRRERTARIDLMRRP
jgi:hypothetical protein